MANFLNNTQDEAFRAPSKKSRYDYTWRSTMSSPRTGILSFIRFDLGQNWDV